MVNYKNRIVQEDMKALSALSIDWERLKGKTIFITGATGMLASYCSFLLFYLNEMHDFQIKIILLARNAKKLEQVFGNQIENATVLLQDICTPINYSGKVDFIIHAAGAASPYFIKNDPVGIIRANTEGTINVLELAKESKTQKVVFLSTREIYGKVENVEKIAETDMGVLNPLDVRSCYPESKRMAETILKSYANQHQVPFNTLRIAHSFGPGMKIENDGRVMADFISDAVQKKDILLKSTGEMERAFCYITDAVSAIFISLIYGEINAAYNIANETEPIKILDLAKLVLKLSKSEKKVKIDISEDKSGYTSYRRFGLDTAKIESLDWYPKISLKEGLLRTLDSFKN